MLGFLNVLKPPGMTSHDVVDFIRRLVGTKQVGHAGTLDPGAAGVLVVGVGFAVRLFEFMADASKSYRAQFTFGIETDTGDAQGEITRQADANDITEAEVRRALQNFIGDLDQQPPAFSAVHVGGTRLHQLARRGIAIEAPLRRVTVSRLDLLSMHNSEALLDLDCSTGTYVRSLAMDLGTRLGCGAHLSFLLRTRVGNFRLADSATLEELADAAERNALHEHIIVPRAALAPIEVVRVNAAQRDRVEHGAAIRCESNGSAAAHRDHDAIPPHALIEDESGLLLAIARGQRDGDGLFWQPAKVNPEVAG